MGMPASDTSRTTGRATLLAGLSGLALGALWLLFTATLRPHELLVGCVTVVLATLFLIPIYTRAQQEFEVRLHDLLSVWRVPWYVFSSLWEIVCVLFADLFGIERAPSFFRVCGFQTSKDDPVLVTRRALATTYTSVAPNFIVIGIDYDQSRMLFHQIRRSRVPLMTKQLGARVSQDPLRHATE